MMGELAMGRPQASRKRAVRWLRLSGAALAAAERSPAGSHLQRSAHGAAKTGPRRALGWRGLVIGLGFVIVVVLGGVALLATVLRTFDADGRPTTVVVASLPFWNLTDDTGIVAAHPGTFTEVSPWVYGLTATGQIAKQAPQRAAEIDAATHRLRTLGIPLIPSIANVTDGRWAYRPVATMLHDPAATARHIAGIVTLVNREGYAGVDIGRPPTGRRSPRSWLAWAARCMPTTRFSRLPCSPRLPMPAKTYATSLRITRLSAQSWTRSG